MDNSATDGKSTDENPVDAPPPSEKSPEEHEDGEAANNAGANNTDENLDTNADENLDGNGEDDDDEEDEEDEDNIKVTIEEYDFKAIQKQTQPAKQAAPLVLETNQEPVDINQLDEKPWRKPGADINDYFNYGFDETTWRIYCDKQKQMKAIVDEINEPQETFKIPVVHAAPMVQANVLPYMDERLSHVVMDSRNPPLAPPLGIQQHHQQHHHQQHQHQHHPAGGSGRMKGVEDDVKKYERRHNRSSERRHSSKSRERRHSKSREREREKDKEKDKEKERKRSRSRDRRSKETRSRPRSRSREDERRSKRHKSSRHA